MFDFKTEILKAEKNIRDYVRETPLDFSIPLSKLTHSNLFLKCENLQYTGSFKVRGALNALLNLNHEKRIVTASSGNHGAAIAYGLQQLNRSGIIFVPENVSSTKRENINYYSEHLDFYGTDCAETELHAKDYARQHNITYISPYNNLQVIAGQGTIAVELMRQLNHIDVIFVPVGGGGLISGIASYIKNVSPNTKIIGCLPTNSPVMAESIKLGKLIAMETLPTLSDATAGGIDPDSITFELCQTYVDDYVLVSESEIQSAIITLLKTHHLFIEGAAALALASFLKCAKHYEDKNAVVVLSGANISLDTIRDVLR